MNKRLVFVNLLVLGLSVVGKINGDSNDEPKAYHHEREQHDHHAHQEKYHHQAHQKNHESNQKDESHHHVRQKVHENHRKGEEKHHFYHILGLHHQVKHHKVMKTRAGNQTSSCVNTTICIDDQSAAVLRWLNGTLEFQFLLLIMPPCFRINITIPNPNGTYTPPPFPGSNPNDTGTSNVTSPPGGINVSFPIPITNVSNITLPGPINITNCTIPDLYDPKEPYPIITYIAKLFAQWLTSAINGWSDLLKRSPIFGAIWKAFLRGLYLGGCGGLCIRNLELLFGCNNGTFDGKTLFDPDRFKQLLPPWFNLNLTKIVPDIGILLPPLFG